MWPKHWTKTADQLAKLLVHWDGAKAQVWEYSTSHGQLLIRFFREGGNPLHSLYLLCNDCRTVHFHSYWLNMQVRIELRSETDHLVTDGDRLRVECGAVSGAETDTLLHLQYQSFLSV
jgi:hypothetical protein